MAECAIINNKRISSNMKKERTIMKKLLALLLVLCMVVSLTACADKDEGPAYDGTDAPPVV